MGAFRLPNPEGGRGGWGNINPAGGGPQGNQFFGTLPSLSVPAGPGATPANMGFANGPGATGGTADVGNGLVAGLPIDPNFSGAFLSYLNSMIGKGAAKFGGQVNLPGGGVTKPGQLSAPIDPFMKQIMAMLSGQLPGSSTLSEMGKTGDPSQIPGMLTSSTDPTNTLPAWQAAVEASQRNIGENAANLKEQFNFSGQLASSPMAQGMSDFFSQTAKDQNAALLQSTQQALEASQGRKLQVGQDILGASEAAAGRKLSAAEAAGQLGLGKDQIGAQIGEFLQGLDQQAIMNLYQEFLRTRPIYNPLMNEMFGAATTFPPYTQKPKGGGVLGGIMSGIGELAGGLLGTNSGGGLLSMFGGGGGGGMPAGSTGGA